jgi:hypothetical protein
MNFPLAFCVFSRDRWGHDLVPSGRPSRYEGIVDQLPNDGEPRLIKDSRPFTKTT